MQLVYMGFTQEAALRCFHFQRVVTQARLTNIPRTVHFTMKADMSLFMQFRIPVQEGPALCHQILTDALTLAETAAEDAELPAFYAVTTEHLSNFAAARTSVEAARAARRKPPRQPFKPSASSQLKLPPRIN